MDEEEHRARSTAPSEAWRLWTLGIAGAYVVLCLWLDAELNVWRDEMYSLHTTSGSAAHAAWLALHFELQPPVYFALLSFWRTIDDSVWMARALSTASAAFAIYITASLARRLAPRQPPALFAALVATHPFMVWAGTEIRVYALAVLLSVLLLALFVDTYGRASTGPPRPAKRAAFVALALVALSTQYYLALLLLAFGLALFALGGRASVLRYTADGCAVALLALPLAFAAREQVAGHRADLAMGADLGLGALRHALRRSETYLLSFNEVLDQVPWSPAALRAARWGYRALGAAALVLGAVRLGRVAGDGRTNTTGLLLATAAGYVLLLALLFAAVGPMSVGARHTAGFLIPLLVAATAAPLGFTARAGAGVWLGFLIASNVVATAILHLGPLAKDCDCRRVARTLEGLETGHEPILVFPAEDVLPLSAYYHGRNRLVPVPSSPSYERWDQSRFVLRSTEDVARALEGDGAAARAIWVQTNTYGESWGREHLEAYLVDTYREVFRQQFARGVLLRRLLPRAESR